MNSLNHKFFIIKLKTTMTISEECQVGMNPRLRSGEVPWQSADAARGSMRVIWFESGIIGARF